MKIKKATMERHVAELRLGKVRYDDFPLHINKKAHKLWAGKVVKVDLNEKYPVKIEWLEKTYLEDDLYYELDSVNVGDYLKVNAGSYKNKYPGYLKVIQVDSEKLITQEVKEKKVISNFELVEENIRRDIYNILLDIDNIEELKNIYKVLMKKGVDINESRY